MTTKQTTQTAAGNSPRVGIKDCGDYFRVRWLDGLGEISCYTKDAYGFASVPELRKWIINERPAYEI